MMDVIKYLAGEWQLVSAAPVSILCIASLAATFGFVVARYRFGTLADLAQERRQLAEDQCKKLAVELKELKENANSNTGIEELRAHIDKLPRIFASPTEPKEAKDNDIWIKTETDEVRGRVLLRDHNEMWPWPPRVADITCKGRLTEEQIPGLKLLELRHITDKELEFLLDNTCRLQKRFADKSFGRSLYHARKELIGKTLSEIGAMEYPLRS